MMSNHGMANPFGGGDNFSTSFDAFEQELMNPPAAADPGPQGMKLRKIYFFQFQTTIDGMLRVEVVHCRKKKLELSSHPAAAGRAPFDGRGAAPALRSDGRAIYHPESAVSRQPDRDVRHVRATAATPA